MENKQSQSGVGFFGLLTLVFIALKLMGYIDWQWKWVLAPIVKFCMARPWHGRARQCIVQA